MKAVLYLSFLCSSALAGPLRLVGTVQLFNPPSAILETTNGQFSMKLGETIGDLTLLQIKDKSAVLQDGNKLVELHLYSATVMYHPPNPYMPLKPGPESPELYMTPELMRELHISLDD